MINLAYNIVNKFFSTSGWLRIIEQIISNIEETCLASITEVETGYGLSSALFKKKIIEKVIYFHSVYGLESGHCVIVKQANSIDFFINFFACYFLNVTVVPVDPDINEKELARLVDHSCPALVISMENEIFLPASKNSNLQDIALILFTSGTSSFPKGVMISKAALNRKMEILSQNVGDSVVENTLCFIPTFFGHGLICNSLYPIFKGKNFYISKKMSIELAARFHEILKNNKITFFSSVPSHWELLLEFSCPPISHSLLRINCASAPLKKEKMKNILNWVKDIPFYDVYGATELLGWFADRQITKNSLESGFQNFWGVDHEINPSGELLLRSDYMFTGYWEKNILLNNLSNELLGSEANFFNTGDLFLDGQIIGRTKNVINKNGIKLQIEDIVSDFLESNLLEDAAAFPIDDPFTGEQVGLFVVLKDKIQLSDLTNYCKKEISPHKHPSEIFVVSRIPTSSRGKTSTRQLVDKYFEHKSLEDKILIIFNTIFKSDYREINLSRDQVMNWDSMRHAELVIEIQRKFKIRFNAKDISNISNLSQVKNLIFDKVAVV
jgi:acyl-CoA synthetase (AMP-forming)/AMP-acid ligase II